MSPDYISSRVRTWRPFFCFNPAAHFCLLLLVCASPRVIAAQGPEYFAGDPHVLDARISPDGAWLLKRVRDAASRRLKIEIYDAARPNSAAQLVADGTWEYESSAWVGNSHVMVALAPVGDQNAEEDSPAAGILDVRDGQLRPLHAHVDRLENALVADEDSIIVSAPSGAAASTPDVGMPGFEPRDYYSVSLAGYDLEPIDQIGLPLANIDFDSKGTPLIARTVDAKIGQVRWWHRPQGEWRAFRSQPLSGVAEFLVFGQDPDKEGHIIVAARNGHDKLGAWSFDTATGRFAELLYRREDVDARGVRQHSNTWQNPARIVGLGYHTDRWHYEYFDAEEAALYAQLADLVDNSHELQVLSRSRNGDMLTFVNRGPRDAGTFYMLRNGRLIIVGKSLPEISATDLSAVRYTTLDAAGNSIPVFLMRPAGDPPFPAVVLVPNGLFSHVSITYDALAQLLAHRGYLVAQPILPGMLGYGAKFTEAATSGGGQGGFDMLTDIQTVARKLVEERLADSTRVAIAGWGFGGYTALAAASKNNGSFRCALAGMPVTDIDKFVDFLEQRPSSGLQRRQVRFWKDSLDPLEHAVSVDIPILLVRGSAGNSEDPLGADRYVALLRQNGISHADVELDQVIDAYELLSESNRLRFMNVVLEFLSGSCG